MVARAITQRLTQAPRLPIDAFHSVTKLSRIHRRLRHQLIPGSRIPGLTVTFLLQRLSINQGILASLLAEKRAIKKPLLSGFFIHTLSLIVHAWHLETNTGC